MKIKMLVPVVLSAVIGFMPLSAMAQSSPVSPGIELTGTMDQTITSSNAQVGQQFQISNVTSQGSNAVANATIYGHVAAVTTAGQGRNAQIQLAYDSLRTYDGQRYSLDARPVHINVVTKNNAAREGVGAVVGDLLGNYVGKVLGVGLLGPIGLAGGFLFAKNARQNVTIPQNSLITLQVIRSRRQA